MGQIRWTERASRNLEDIWKYISTDSPHYATQFITSLINSTSLLESMPFCGRKVPEFDQYDFRELIRRGYRIIYQVIHAENDVEILAVVHCSQDLSKKMQDD